MVKMTINLLWDVDGWMSKGKRWVGTAEGKQRSCTDGAVPETLTVGPKIWRIFEKEEKKGENSLRILRIKRSKFIADI